MVDKFQMKSGWAALVSVVLIAGCGVSSQRDGPPDRPVDLTHVPDAVPRVEPKSRYGNPDSYIVAGRRYHTRASSHGYVERGVASWYGKKFHGRRTSSGEPYDMYAMTAAHRSLPLPTYARVVNLENGREVVLKINDRGPFHDNRVIDLSYAAAYRLGILGRGTGLVEVRAIDPGRLAVVAEAPRARPAAPRAQPVVSSIVDPTVNPGVYIQAGAFRERVNAERLKIRLQSLAGSAVGIYEMRNNGRPLYRVRLGPLDGVDQADRLVERLAASGMDELRLVME